MSVRNVPSELRLQEISTSCHDRTELEGKGVKRKYDEVLDIYPTNVMDGRADRADEYMRGAKEHFHDPRPSKTRKLEDEARRSGNRKKTDDAVVDNAARVKPEWRRKDSLEMRKHSGGDKQLSCSGRRHQDAENYHDKFHEKRVTWERELDALLSPGRNRKTIIHVGAGGDKALKSSVVHDRRWTYRMRRYEEGRKCWHRHSDIHRCFVKEKLELGSTAVRKSARCAAGMIDLMRTKNENTYVKRNGLEIKKRFSSKIVIPDVKLEEPHPTEVSTSNGDNMLKQVDQEEKNSNVLTGAGQGDGSKKSTKLDEMIDNGVSTTREADSHKCEDVHSKQSARMTDSVNGYEHGLMDQQKTKSIAETQWTSIKGVDETEKMSAKQRNVKESQTSQKLRDTKNNSDLQGKDDNRRGMERKSRGLSKKSGGLKCTRPEGTVSRKSLKVHSSKTVKGGKETTVKSKESTLRRRAIKVGRARDDDGHRLSSHEPKHHKHRGSSHSVSPKLRNHTPQKKEHGKSMSPRKSEKDLSDWEKFDRERNNTLAVFDSRYRRFGGGTSGLGGYSPRRRRSEAAIKTPSPPPRSPDRRKPRAWDLPPPGMDKSMVAAISAVAQQAVIKQAATALASVTPHVSGSVILSSGATTASTSCGFTPTPTTIPSLLQQVSPVVTAVSLTQATRPLRRLYVGNVPATVSDGELLEFMNAAMLSANANHLAGTKPCINCSVNVDKSYAFAEFITPEDATAALAFDGVTLHGTTLKIRRPKDFTLPANGGAENASPSIDMVSNVVQDSPHKVFVGGISSSLSAEKVKEIVTAFGQLRAYHWEVDKSKQPPQAYAFLEYMDPAATLRACAGLNGIKLGTKFLTVAQATPDANPKVATTETPFYGVPEHAKTLLQAPSRILELRNLLAEDEMQVISREEMDDITEDIRLECSRFGNVKSMHIMQFPPALEHAKEDGDPSSDLGNCGERRYAGKPTSSAQELGLMEVAPEPKMVGVSSVDGTRSENLRRICSPRDGSSYSERTDEKNQNRISEPVSSRQTANIYCAETSGIEHSDMWTNTSGTQRDKTFSKSEDLNTEGLHIMAINRTAGTSMVTSSMPRESVEGTGVDGRNEPNELEEELAASQLEFCSLHVGKVFVEFSRAESACQAAHNLHGRTFGGRKVSVSYFPLKTYQKRFHKGLEPRTYQEKQALALAVQGHLTTDIKN